MKNIIAVFVLITTCLFSLTTQARNSDKTWTPILIAQNTNASDSIMIGNVAPGIDESGRLSEIPSSNIAPAPAAPAISDPTPEISIGNIAPGIDENGRLSAIPRNNIAPAAPTFSDPAPTEKLKIPTTPSPQTAGGFKPPSNSGVIPENFPAPTGSGNPVSNIMPADNKLPIGTPPAGNENGVTSSIPVIDGPSVQGNMTTLPNEQVIVGDEDLLQELLSLSPENNAGTGEDALPGDNKESVLGNNDQDSVFDSDSPYRVKLEPRVWVKDNKSKTTSILKNTLTPFTSYPILLPRNFSFSQYGRIVTILNPRLQISENDKIIASNVSPENKSWNIYRINDRVKGVRRAYADWVGMAKFVRSRTSRLSVLQITKAQTEIAVGDILIPTKLEDTLSIVPKIPRTKISEKVLAVPGNNGDLSVVVISGGTKKGIAEGNVLTIRREIDAQKTSSYSTFSFGFLGDVFEKYATILVFKSYDDVSFGLVTDTNRVINVGDQVITAASDD